MADERKRAVKFAKVHRAVYSFNVSKLFVPVRRFIKKSTELTPELIKEYILSIFGANVRKDTKSKERALAMESKSPGIRNIILIAVAAILLIVGYGAFVYMGVGKQTAQLPPSQAVQLAAPAIVAHLADSGFLDSGQKGTRWFASVDIEGENLDEMTLSFLVQQNEIPHDVYALRVPNYQFASH